MSSRYIGNSTSSAVYINDLHKRIVAVTKGLEKRPS